MGSSPCCRRVLLTLKPVSTICTPLSAARTATRSGLEACAGGRTGIAVPVATGGVVGATVGATLGVEGTTVEGTADVAATAATVATTAVVVGDDSRLTSKVPQAEASRLNPNATSNS